MVGQRLFATNLGCDRGCKFNIGSDFWFTEIEIDCMCGLIAKFSCAGFAEHRPHRGDAVDVRLPALGAVDCLMHQFGPVVVCFAHSVEQVRHACLCSLGALDSLTTQLAELAFPLRRREPLHSVATSTV